MKGESYFRKLDELDPDAHDLGDGRSRIATLVAQAMSRHDTCGCTCHDDEAGPICDDCEQDCPHTREDS